MTVTTTQSRFRFRSDTLTVDSASVAWAAAENVNAAPTPVQRGVPFRVRIEITSTGSTAYTGTFNLYCSKNGGTAAAMASAPPTGIAMSAAASVDADNTSLTVSRLTADGTTFNNGQYDNSGATGSLTLPAGSTTSNRTEFEFGLTLTTVAALGDTFAFTVRRGSTAMTISQTPTVTVSQAVLTATNDTTAADALGTPSFVQTNVLTATAIASGAAAYDHPVASLVNILTASNVASGAAVLGTPSSTTKSSLTSTDFFPLGAPRETSDVTFGLVPNNALTANNLASTGSALSSPTLATTYAFTSTTVASSAAGLIAPAFNQTDKLGAASIAGSVAFTTPSLTVSLGLQATSLATGADAIGTGAVLQNHVLVASALASLADAYVHPSFVGISSLAASSIATGSDAIVATAIHQTHGLAATVTAGAAGIGQPTLLLAGQMAVVPIATSAASLGVPAFAQKQSLTATTIATTSDALGTPAFAGVSGLVANGIGTTVLIGTASFAQRHALIAQPVATSAGIDRPAFSIVDVEWVMDLATGFGAIDTPVLNVIPNLVARDIATSFAIDRPVLSLVAVPLVASDLASQPAGIDQPTSSQIIQPTTPPIVIDIPIAEPPRHIDVDTSVPDPFDVTIVTGRTIPLFVYTESSISIDIVSQEIAIDVPIAELPRRIDI